MYNCLYSVTVQGWLLQYLELEREDVGWLPYVAFRNIIWLYGLLLNLISCYKKKNPNKTMFRKPDTILVHKCDCESCHILRYDYQ